jgi:hypothetical protein
MITKLMQTVNFPQFFEFVLEFGKFYCRVLNEQVLILFDSVVARVIYEQNSREGKSDPSSVTIGKCMNIIRMLVEKKEYISAFAEQFEEKLKPLYIYMAEPQKINFDEDIVIILKSFIKKCERITPTQWEIYE